MNKVTLIGRLVRDPELKYVGESQIPVTDFILAVDRKFKDKQGDKKTDFIRVELWDKQAETFYKYLERGKRVAIEGSLRVDMIKDLEGENKFYTKVKASKFEFLDYKKEKKAEKSS